MFGLSLVVHFDLTSNETKASSRSECLYAVYCTHLSWCLSIGMFRIKNQSMFLQYMYFFFLRCVIVIKMNKATASGEGTGET